MDVVGWNGVDWSGVVKDSGHDLDEQIFVHSVSDDIDACPLPINRVLTKLEVDEERFVLGYASEYEGQRANTAFAVQLLE